ncbi:EF-hand domain-containing protein [Aliiglaciecola sp. LCG003]|uniref:EF-hand domain-containing protein n=1 Tax=Aliiglaciecola sp. LCG003 TaxID=3053655 RepID=UPI00257416E0|nr:EF-hand domain-containing protein [Aliiglaciecola sp. LCG003]WJG11118.1 EF-hand domain-containing protein [Aliiglaciecola sp. LCG003]
MKTLILFSTLVLAASALAQDDRFMALDMNNDGRISADEVASDPELAAAFAELDIDHDGYLTPRELSEH